MRQEFLEALSRQKLTGAPFSIATVIRVEGSASARTGSRAIFDSSGQNLFGWVGGGCAERFIGEQTVEAVRENHTRIVTADLDDEIFGLGIACGGRMDVFIEPIFPNEVISLPRLEKLKNEAEFLARTYGWSVEWSEKTLETSELRELLPVLAEAICRTRNKESLTSLRDRKDLPIRFSSKPHKIHKNVLIVGRSRITEALARLFTLLGWQIRVFGPSIDKKDYPGLVKCECLFETYDELQFEPQSAVIVASHHAHDADFVKRALEAGAGYVAMVGSRKRAFEVINKLGLEAGRTSELPLYIPAGLDLDARNPEEIALSIATEILLQMETLS